MTGTKLYADMLAFNSDDAERAILMEKVWRGTPWMVDVYTGGSNDPRDRQMLEWCHDNFGGEAWPIHGRPGAWHRASATIFGWTWFGFQTEEQMNQFVAAWPTPDGVALPSKEGTEE